MSRGHRHLRKKRDKPREEHAPRVNITPAREEPPREETLKPAIHGGYTHPWGLRYYEYTVWKGEGAK